MHSRDRVGGGWSAIIDPDEEGFGDEEEAQTDPQMVRNEVISFSTEEKTTIDKLDPVTRAMLEAEPEPARGKPSISASSGPRGPSPSGQPRKLRLPVPGENAPKKSRNGGVVESYTPQSMPAIAPDPASKPQSGSNPNITNSAASGFSSESLVEKLSEGTGRASKTKPSFFTEYKEVVRAVVIGVVLLGGGIAYQLTRSPAEPAPVIIPEMPQTAAATKEEPPKTIEKVPAEPNEQPPSLPRETEQKSIAVLTNPNGDEPAETPNPAKAATPMITVISTPPGATVEINGDGQGKTPLILRSPRNISMLTISIQLHNHKKWQQDVPANEAGHFTVNAQLEKIR
jgi:hypothetical protein